MTLASHKGSGNIMVRPSVPHGVPQIWNRQTNEAQNDIIFAVMQLSGDTCLV
uniref:Uncharacterized protein n=1 Tax=Arion vulgaris TaxID=1028688 RepID=A0A0B7AJZ0_9EUPU